MDNLIAKIKEQKLFKNLTYQTLIFILLVITVISFNSAKLIKRTLRLKRIRAILPLYFPGFKFSGLNNIFSIIGNVSHIGYYTDKDLFENKHAQQFSQAQFMIAPIILDTNYENYEFILFDCSSETVALKKIKELGAFPLKKNNFGIILARKPL